jgi:tetratricopeptide (TPR) repeat protein
MIFHGIDKRGWAILPAALALLLVLSACTAIKNRKSATDYFDDGASLVQRGKCGEGIQEYKKGLRREPRSAVGYNYLGIAYRCKYEKLRSLKWREEEIQAFKKAIELDPHFYLPYINLGTTYYNMGNGKEATVYFRKGLELYPDHPSREFIEEMIQEGEREGR